MRATLADSSTGSATDLDEVSSAKRRRLAEPVVGQALPDQPATPVPPIVAPLPAVTCRDVQPPPIRSLVLGLTAAVGNAADFATAGENAAGGCCVHVAAAANGVAAFELPPEFEDDMPGIPQQEQFDADMDEDVFGHGDDLGAAAYFDHE